jgi:hypothetical protein
MQERQAASLPRFVNLPRWNAVALREQEFCNRVSVQLFKRRIR